MLCVVGAQPAQRRAQVGDVERVHARVDLADRALRRARVGLLDDADDLVVLRAQHAAVARGVGHGGGHHGDRGGFGAVACDEAGQGLGVEQRDVT